MSFHQTVPNNYVTQEENRITPLKDKVHTLGKTLQDLLDEVKEIEAKVNIIN
jgi:hypothetical protein